MPNHPPDSTPVTRHLDRLSVPYRIFTHPHPVESLQQAAIERGQRPEQVIRSIVFRISGSQENADDFIMVLVSGPDQISWPDLRHHLGLSRITMASKEEVLLRTSYQTGAVSPFGLPQPMRILVDQRVFEQDEISLGSGVRNTTVILSSADLRRALEPVEIGCFVEC
jgi:Cys-tRNA(Pro)/Cys-tRNA(Cys) deacylase